jgi:nucleoid-associated protein YgaU
MRSIKTLITISVFFFLTSALYAQSYNYEEMTQEQYNAYLAEWQGRLDAGNSGISEQDATIDELNKELQSMDAEYGQTWNDIFAATGTSQEEYNSYQDAISQLKKDVAAFLAMSPDQIYQNAAELDKLQARLTELQNNHFGVMSENEADLNEIASMIEQARGKGKSAVPPSYTVQRGDYLWKIAKMPDIYGDAYAWMRIYTSNKEQIKDPNLIYPNQSFLIPREVGPNQHLVVRGEYLYKIAGYSNVYGNAFQWQKLFENNKEVITDPNIIFPYQVLNIAR